MGQGGPRVGLMPASSRIRPFHGTNSRSTYGFTLRSMEPKVTRCVVVYTIISMPARQPLWTQCEVRRSARTAKNELAPVHLVIRFRRIRGWSNRVTKWVMYWVSTTNSASDVSHGANAESKAPEIALHNLFGPHFLCWPRRAVSFLALRCHRHR
jgi:hypothetical protein